MLEDLGNLGDFVGGIGVAVTLVYLAIQIRSNTQQVEENSRLLGLQAHQAVGERCSDVLSEVAKDSELFQIGAAGFKFEEDRDPKVVQQYGMILHKLFMSLEDAENFSEYDERVRERIERPEIHWIRSPSLQDWWSRQRIAYSDTFRSRIDARIRDVNAGKDMTSADIPTA